MSFRDLEQGLGGEEPTPLAPRGRTAERDVPSSRAESTEFMRLTEQVGLHVFRINANVSTLQKLDARLRKSGYQSNDDLRRQLYVALLTQQRPERADALDRQGRD